MWNKIKKNKIITVLIAAAIAAAISYGTTGSVNPITVFQAIQRTTQTIPLPTPLQDRKAAPAVNSIVGTTKRFTERE